MDARRLGLADLMGESTLRASRGLRLPTVNAVRVVVEGKVHDVLTDAPTVGELLSAMRIRREGGPVTPPPGTPVSRTGHVVVADRQDQPVTTSQGAQYGEAAWYEVPGEGAAHPWLPLGTEVTVTNLATGESRTVVINDRGPFGGRIIDLSRAAFQALAPLGQGVMAVRLTW